MMQQLKGFVPLLAVTVASVLAGSQSHGAVFTATGSNPSDIQATVDSFRTALGPLNPNVAGSFPTGRREINWDGVPDNLSAPNLLPNNFFNVNSPRGAVFTGGTGVQVSADSANPTSEPILFGGLNAGYPAQFQIFSAQRLFTGLGSNTVQIDFFVPGSSTPATVAGFGAVFTDVEIQNGTNFTVFLANGTNGGQFSVPTSPSGGLSFLGLTESAGFSRIIIQFGTLIPGVTENLANNLDAVAMDDFIYGEPQAQAGEIPEPSTILLSAAGLLAVIAFRHRRNTA